MRRFGLALIWLWRSSASFALKGAALCLPAMPASPYEYDDDMMVVAPAIAFLTSDFLIPLGVIGMIVVHVAILRRAAMATHEPRQTPAAAAP